MPSDSLRAPPPDDRQKQPTLRLRHYGIVIIGFAALSTFMSAPGQTHSMASLRNVREVVLVMATMNSPETPADY